MIRDQLAAHATDPKLREKLPLLKAVEMAFQLKSAALLAAKKLTGIPQQDYRLAMRRDCHCKLKLEWVTTQKKQDTE